MNQKRCFSLWDYCCCKRSHWDGDWGNFGCCGWIWVSQNSDIAKKVVFKMGKFGFLKGFAGSSCWLRSCHHLHFTPLWVSPHSSISIKEPATFLLTKMITSTNYKNRESSSSCLFSTPAIIIIVIIITLLQTSASMAATTRPSVAPLPSSPARLDRLVRFWCWCWSWWSWLSWCWWWWWCSRQWWSPLQVMAGEAAAVSPSTVHVAISRCEPLICWKIILCIVTVVIKLLVLTIFHEYVTIKVFLSPSASLRGCERRRQVTRLSSELLLRWVFILSVEYWVWLYSPSGNSYWGEHLLWVLSIELSVTRAG